MKLRILTAVPLALLVVWLILGAPQWVFLLALLATVEISLYEFFKLSRGAGQPAFAAVGYMAGGALCLAQAADPAAAGPGALGWAVLVLLVLVTLSLPLGWKGELKNYLGSTSATILGVLYIAFPLSLLVPLRWADPPAGRKLMALLFFVIWAGDIVAYFVGRAIGRTPLLPRISPKKTVEGAIGGLVGSLLVGWVIGKWFWRTASLKTVILMAGAIAVAGQVGDLAESALKRSADVKDTGTLLPGHGGLLDRVDSLLFGTPALWLALAIQDLWRRP